MLAREEGTIEAKRGAAAIDLRPCAADQLEECTARHPASTTRGSFGGTAAATGG